MTYQPKVEPCRSCQAPIVWAKTKNDKWAPFDAVPERRFILHPGEDGVLRAEAQPTYQSHYATCPDAKAWRAGAAGKPPNEQPPPPAISKDEARVEMHRTMVVTPSRERADLT